MMKKKWDRGENWACPDSEERAHSKEKIIKIDRWKLRKLFLIAASYLNLATLKKILFTCSPSHTLHFLSRRRSLLIMLFFSFHFLLTETPAQAIEQCYLITNFLLYRMDKLAFAFAIKVLLISQLPFCSILRCLRRLLCISLDESFFFLFFTMNTVWAHEIGNRQKWSVATRNNKKKELSTGSSHRLANHCLWYRVWIYNTSEALNARESDHCIIFPLFERLIYNSLLNSVIIFFSFCAELCESFDQLWLIFFSALNSERKRARRKRLEIYDFFLIWFSSVFKYFDFRILFFSMFIAHEDHHYFFALSACNNAVHLQLNWLFVALINWH